MGILRSIIIILEQTLILVIILKVFLSYFVDPFHPLRQAVDRVVEPMLRPIRQIVPAVGRFDFSPVILLLLVSVVSRLLLSII